MNLKLSVADEKRVSAVAAVIYALKFVAQQQGVSLPEINLAARAAKHLAVIRPDETVVDLQALVVERELSAFAPDRTTLCKWRIAAGLIDVGARPLLSERAAETIAQISISSVIER